MGKGKTVRTPFAGESLSLRHRHHKAGRSAVLVQAAIATQRLKVPKAIKQGTQKIGAAAKKAAPKKSATQPVLKPLVPPVSGTQIKKAAKVLGIEVFPMEAACPLLGRWRHLTITWHGGCTLRSKRGLVSCSSHPLLCLEKRGRASAPGRAAQLALRPPCWQGMT